MREQGSMYHIWTPKGQVQLLAPKGAHLLRQVPAAGLRRPGGGIELADTVRGGVACMDDQGDRLTPQYRFHPRRSGDDLPCLVGERKPLKRGLFQQSLDQIGQIRGRGRLAPAVGAEQG